ncbi:putative Metallo-beta-lactamase superfamily [Nitrospina gracilis 3/211]|uniref:Putative Metallo-beta-lactamase superfamily n=1 Tax=Nitrospina gracilis (strain 3/211) TaxID=1266370 RepID=M1YFQ8_NITG3|nr:MULTISPECIES: DNA internalization-related competence protein ComEC/Rec2 [Nitrospina]MCF8722088.1 competence protein ComEC [Nitrospina sp. Nb-3]CCQ89277.1 putative Metallo-beta-lactamase superfamily [Nitrospina gracilis 3/211]
MGPLLPYFLFYLSGIFLAHPASREFLFPFALPFAALVLAVWCARRLRIRATWQFILLAMLFVLGATTSYRAKALRPDHHILNHVEDSRRGDITGVVIQPPQYYPDRVRVHLDLESLQYHDTPIGVTGSARITVYEAKADLREGDRIRVHQVRLKRPRNFKNPGRFDYEHYMQTEGLDVTGGVSKAERVERIDATESTTLSRWHEAMLHSVRALLDRNLDAQKGALLRGMVLGEKEFLSEEMQEAFRATGVAHLMAVSGLHIGFVAGATYFMIHPVLWGLFSYYRPRWVYLGHTQKWAVAFCFLPVLMYLMLVGNKVSALRAGTMVILFMIAVLADRERSVLNALLVAAFGILLWSPGAFLTPGFQLSFGAVFAILYLHRMLMQVQGDAVDRLGEPPWYRRLPALQDEHGGAIASVLRFVYGTAFVSAAAILGTFPALVYQFNRVSAIGFLLNLVLVPLASVLIPATLLIALLNAVLPTLADFLMSGVDGLLGVFVTLPMWAASFDFASFYVPTPPDFWLVLYISLTLGVPAYLYRYHLTAMTPEETPPQKFLTPQRSQAAGLAACALGVFVWWMWPQFPRFQTDTLKITMLDVGQGESVFVEFPNRETLLIDGGGFYRDALDIGKAVVGRFLWHRGERGLDYLAATHSDHDHISGLLSLSKLVEVGHFLDRNPPIADAKIDQLRHTLQENGAKRHILVPGETVEFGEVHLTALHPAGPFIQTVGLPLRRIDNDLSWVLRLDFREFSLLLTGDITAEAEAHLVASAEPLEADVLKVPHHGSRYSSSPDFLKAVGAKDALISAGHVNPFGHPHDETLKRLAEQGTRVWRTDRHGAITLITNGHDYQFKTHEGL